ncbi:MAG: hypothetical protein H6859_04610 [Rhodospirillales bacterium]|nr:hypothetical protein [Alphaproteobacteria bacterium]USO06468.1 MAG: hypothetical protein H6859_04610 [Rhodospirillales bacterium]
MNVKITENSVTFKITEEEMNVLAEGKSLEKSIPMRGHCFEMAIDPCAGGNLEITMDQGRLVLGTTKGQIKKLVGMGKSKEGLFAHIDGLDVFLQVDLRADSRPRIKE